jgi:hypothetical protein
MSAHRLCAAALVLAAAAFTTVPASGALIFTGTPLTENFDSYAGAVAQLPFANNSTVPGLYLYISGGTSAGDSVAGVPDLIARNSTTATAAAATATYPAGNTIAHYFFRSSAAATDVSLGLFNTDSNSRGPGTGYIAAGFAVRNETGFTLDRFGLTYTPVGSSATGLTNTDVVSVSYSLGATGVADGDGTWTEVPGMGYSVTGGAVLTGPTVTEATGLSWAPGQTLFIRWKDVNVGGTDRLSWINNVTIVPEPASAATTLGLGASALLRRRRR